MRIFDGYTTRDATPEEIAEIEQAQREEEPMPPSESDYAETGRILIGEES